MKKRREKRRERRRERRERGVSDYQRAKTEDPNGHTAAVVS